MSRSALVLLILVTGGTSGCGLESSDVMALMSGFSSGMSGVNAHGGSTWSSPPASIPPPRAAPPRGAPRASAPAPTVRIASAPSRPAPTPPARTRAAVVDLPSSSSSTRDEPTAPERPNALVVTARNEANGKWSGVGPVQKLLTWFDTEDEAIDLVTQDEDEARLRFIGHQGTYRVYSLDRPLKKWETDARTRITSVKIVG